MGFVVGIPRCNEPRALLEEAVAAVDASTLRPDELLIVDNGDEPMAPLAVSKRLRTLVYQPPRNLGCAGGWNKLCEMADDRSIVLLNSDCTVARDTFERLYAQAGPVIVRGRGYTCFRLDHGIRSLVGAFDESFYPAYYEDADYEYRCNLLGIEVDRIGPEDEVAVVAPGRTVSTMGVTHGWHVPDSHHGWTGEKYAWFRQQLEANKQRYIAKWGGLPSEETYKTPFDGRGDPSGDR